MAELLQGLTNGVPGLVGHKLRFADANSADPWGFTAQPVPDQYALYRWNLAGVYSDWELLFDNGEPILEWDFTTASLTSIRDSITLVPTRSTTGTYQDAAGAVVTAAIDAARFQYLNGSCLGLLVEDVSTNQVLRTEEAGNAYWSNINCTISSNVTTAPDGAATGDKLVENVTGVAKRHIRRNNFAVTSGTYYTMSAFFKAAERTQSFLEFQAGFGSAPSAVFDLSGSGSIATLGADTVYASIVPFASGWYYCSLTSIATSSTNTLPMYGPASGGTASYAGDGTSGIYVWGMQFGASAHSQSYYASSASLNTRQADLCSILISALPAGVMLTDTILAVAEFYPRQYGSSSRYAFSLSDNTANEAAGIHTATGNVIRGAVIDGGVSQADIAGGSFTRDTLTKAALLFRANDYGVALNGASMVADTSGTLPTVDRLFVGQGPTGAGQLNGVIKRIRFYNARRTNQSISTLTV